MPARKFNPINTLALSIGDSSPGECLSHLQEVALFSETSAFVRVVKTIICILRKIRQAGVVPMRWPLPESAALLGGRVLRMNKLPLGNYYYRHECGPSLSDFSEI